MFKKVLFILAISSAILTNPVFAEDSVAIELAASKTEISVGETFQLSVRLKNASTGEVNLGNFNIPGIESFSQQGSSQSTKVQIVNGATMAVKEILLTLAAEDEGVFDIGPIIIASNGLQAESNSLKVTVGKAEKKSFFDKKTADEEDKTLGRTKKVDIKGILTNIVAFVLLLYFLFLLYQRQGGKKDTLKKIRSNNVAGVETNKISIPKVDDEKFYIKTKEAILLFLQEKYQVDTEVLTSYEVLKKLKLKKVYQLNEIEQALSLCDQGSFAKNDLIKKELLDIIKKIK